MSCIDLYFLVYVDFMQTVKCLKPADKFYEIVFGKRLTVCIKDSCLEKLYQKFNTRWCFELFFA